MRILSKKSQRCRENKILEACNILIRVLGEEAVVVKDGESLHIFSHRKLSQEEIKSLLASGKYLTAEEILEEF